MIYRTKTYIAFDGDEDLMSYRTMQGWDRDNDTSFEFNDAHQYNFANDDSLPESIISQLKERLDRSKHFILIIGNNIKRNRKGILQYEIRYALRNRLPIILVYKGYSSSHVNTNELGNTLLAKLPSALTTYTGNKYCCVCPFTRDVIGRAKNTYNHNNLPDEGYSWFWR